MAKQKMTKKQQESRVEAARRQEQRAQEKKAKQERNKRIFTFAVVAVLIIGLSFPTMALVVMGGGQ